MAFTVATYNVLATAYSKPARYPASPASVLDPRYRVPAVVERLVQLRADLLCLQEVEDALFQAAMQRLVPLGYRGILTGKTRGQPDGCATFFRTATFALVQTTPLEYRDATDHTPPSGHIAQLLILQNGPYLLGIANTHLRWSPPGTAQHYGYRQMQLLLQAHAAQDARCAGWLLCGDLNVTPESPVVRLLQASGFDYSHARYSAAATCYANGQAHMLDFVFYKGALQADPLALPLVTDTTPLPSFDHPSDHVPVVTRCTWIAPHSGSANLAE